MNKTKYKINNYEIKEVLLTFTTDNTVFSVTVDDRLFRNHPKAKEVKNFRDLLMKYHSYIHSKKWAAISIIQDGQIVHEEYRIGTKRGKSKRLTQKEWEYRYQ